MIAKSKPNWRSSDLGLYFLSSGVVGDVLVHEFAKQIYMTKIYFYKQLFMALLKML